jgi:hypothetical protein
MLSYYMKVSYVVNREGAKSILFQYVLSIL